MRICIVTPAPPRSRHGNRATALRWARLLRELGHSVVVAQSYENQPCDVLVALHARRSAPSVERFRRRHPRASLVVALTGTDVYGDLDDDDLSLRSLELATTCVVLQPLALDRLPEQVRAKTRVIHQSALSPPSIGPGRGPGFAAVVLAHLREVKDPKLAAEAVRLLPSRSAVRVVHLGAPLDAGMEEWARTETNRNPRYEWRGDVPRRRAMQVLARSRVMVLTSKEEGGANALSEALAAGVPVLSSRVDGSVGILGGNYPGYFDSGRADQLAALLERAEVDAEFYGLLRRKCDALRPLVSPDRERRAWSELLAAL